MSRETIEPGDAPEYWARAFDAVLAASQVKSSGFGKLSTDYRFARELVAIAWQYDTELAR